ncbi:hypothetical protein JAAARDRAFT_391763 [Jaapia argillacea MUCL 33604]|uniref:Uncharacterized protein n=1 Tax=Jaapia argillacea MUCL 33604 TaxID=933084 RepID=A0A067QME4_9AGAM|nr:hypothetical protein JAAARDRAFT_391763 [Jaapia argillacea MUCL 33604]
MATSTEPPYYILVSHSTLSDDTHAISASSLNHPIIQYHYADDSPLSLLPTSPDEHVVILDYDVSNPSGTTATAQSISGGLAVIGLKVTDAPGAAAASEGEAKRNDKMFILETTIATQRTTDTSQNISQQDPHSTLARFRNRNSLLRQALDYPESPPTLTSSPLPLPQTLPPSRR